MPKPVQQVKEFEQKFPVDLNFYRKGKDFFLNIAGSAYIVFEPAEIDEMMEVTNLGNNQLKGNWILVKVEIIDARYHASAAVSARHNRLVNVSSLINKWLFPDHSSFNPLAVH
jgi:general stress protein 26